MLRINAISSKLLFFFFTIVMFVFMLIFLYPTMNHKPFMGVSLYNKLYFKIHRTINKKSNNPLAKSIPKPIPIAMRYIDVKKFQAILKQPPSWMNQEIASNFSVYNKFDAYRVLETYEQSLPEDNFVLYTIEGNQVNYFFKNNKINSASRYAISFYQELIQFLVKNEYLGNMSFILRLSDFTAKDYSQIKISDLAPILAVTKDTKKHIDKDSILIPDWMNLETWGRMESKIGKANQSYPWENKKPTVFWRGGPADVTGYRHKAVSYSQRVNTQDMDIKFTYGENKTADYVNPVDHVPYKYQLTIDGHTSAWERPVWQLYSNSVVLKQSSHLNQWYYPALKAGVHFVDVGNEPEELLSIIDQFSDEELKNIAHQGHLFARDNLSIEGMVAYLVLVLQTYQSYQNHH